ncbi:CUB and zona pellucida-like domain-containing protein 1 [Acanthopagrus latus]|uniref:CUB and zona pellucida-like domain-containing protein 1 n=1 Tax=Acanthopagrus latus TaxID=8177 RepID=UPI00187C520A|nr:CUB and zona pellucida-like domain-containing protein 1 [Acanthopagrus latus]
MAFTLVILLLPLLVSLASASHHYGATSTFTYKGKNPDGSHRGATTCEGKETSMVVNNHSWTHNHSSKHKLVVVVVAANHNRSSNHNLMVVVAANHNRSSNHNLMVVVAAKHNPAPTTTTTTAPTTTTTAAPRTTTTAAPTTTTTAAPTTTTTTYPGATGPLSKLPLHFSFLVDPPAPSCQEGLYLPRLLPPTPANGVRIQAEINKELEIKVKAQASAATVIDIIISGPLNISKHRTTNGDFAIRWTPITDELGNSFSVCFAVEAMAGSSIYQSEMRCVVVDVVDQKVKSYVSCSESAMTVEIEKSSFPRLSEDHLRLNDPTNTVCSLQRHSNSTHVVAVIPLNACGTQIEEDEDNLIFTNEITTIDRRTDVITRKHLLEVQVCCQYPKRGNVSQSFTVHRPNVTVWEKGYGKFTYGFEFYPDSTFRTMVDPNSYPLEYEIGSRVFMQIEATSSINNTELFVESCTAAPYDNPNSRPKYTIIENGCNVDSTLQRYTPNHQRQFKFSMEAFKFIGQNNQVYISCSVMMCEAGNPNTRCAQGCINSTQPGGHNIAKREVVTQTSRHLVSQGPLRLKRSAEGAESPVMNLNLNLVFIAGCLLAAVGMISAVVMYKTKVSKVKYQPLPTFES